MPFPPHAIARVAGYVLAYLGTIGTAAAQEPSRLVVRETAAPCLRLRVRPESTSPMLGCLAPGTTVASLGVAPYWRRVSAGDTLEGWAAK